MSALSERKEGYISASTPSHRLPTREELGIKGYIAVKKNGGGTIEYPVTGQWQNEDGQLTVSVQEDMADGRIKRIGTPDISPFSKRSQFDVVLQPGEIELVTWYPQSA